MQMHGSVDGHANSLLCICSKLVCVVDIAVLQFLNGHPGVPGSFWTNRCSEGTEVVQPLLTTVYAVSVLRVCLEPDNLAQVQQQALCQLTGS